MNPIGCFFIGNTDAPESCYPALQEAVEKAIMEYRITSFTVCRCCAFDRMAVRAVTEAKAAHPEITLTVLLPCYPTERTVTLPEEFDDTFYLPDIAETPRRIAVTRAYRYAVNHTDLLIAYARHPSSNAYRFVEYAKKKEKNGNVTVLDLADSP